MSTFDDLASLRLRNLRLLLQEYGSQKALADALGLAPAYVNQMFTGRRGVGERTARKIEQSLEFPLHWLDRVHAGTPADATETAETPDPSRSTPAMKTMPTHANTEPGPDMRGLVPLISWVQAGFWEEAIDNGHPGDGGEGMYACPVPHSTQTYALRVKGDSMTAPYGRSIPEGALVFVDPDQRGGVVSGDVVIAKITGEPEVTLKLFVRDGGRVFLRPLNPQHPVITDKFRVLGKVVGVFSAL